MNKTNTNERKPVEIASNAAQDSQTQPSAQVQKNIPQSNTTEESKIVAQQQLKPDSLDVSEMDEAQLMQAMQNMWKKPEDLSKQRENIKVKIDLARDTTNKLRAANKRIPSLDKRIYSVPTTAPSIATDERMLNELKIISLEKEVVNLLEKDDIISKQFIRACGSEKAALQFEKLLSQAKSKRYHRNTSYFIKQMILEVLNKIIKEDKTGIVEAKKLANDTTDQGIKLFNSKMRDLIELFDEKLVVRCGHYNRELYYEIMRVTLIKWDPEVDLQIEELGVPNES
jgi:hypothetical protein